MDPFSKLVQEELTHLLYEWGVNGESKQHVKFRRMIYEIGRSMVHDRRTTIDYTKLKFASFPKDPTEAIEWVLRKDINSERDVETLYIATDSLNVYEIMPRPYLRRFARRKASHVSSQVIGYSRRKGYESFRPEQLDPFKRLKYLRIKESDFWFRRWYLSTADQDAGKIFEARLACRAIHHEACFQCKYRNTLRWYGGSEASWQDLVCTECKTMYEIKTKASMDDMEQCFSRNMLRGGSFKRYCELRTARDRGKMFIAILPRDFIVNRAGEKIHPVFLVEIDTVLPYMGYSTFRPNRSFTDMDFSSVVSMKLYSKKKWFDLPKYEPVLYGPIMDRLYMERFSEKEFHLWEKKYFENSEDEHFEESKSARETGTIDDQNKATPISDLKSDLEDLKVGDVDTDDWDDLY